MQEASIADFPALLYVKYVIFRNSIYDPFIDIVCIVRVLEDVWFVFYKNIRVSCLYSREEEEDLFDLEREVS